MIKDFTENTGMELPTTVKEYDVIAELISKSTSHLSNNTARSIGRSILCKHGVTATKILDLLNPARAKVLTTHGYTKYQKVADKLGLVISKVDTSIRDIDFTQKDSLLVVCPVCNFTETITATSLNRRKQGCKKCKGQADWVYRETEFLAICASKDITPVYSEYRDILKSKEIPLRCNICDTQFTRGFNNIIYHDKYPTNCPSCKPDRVYGKEGVPTIFNGIEFDSMFELNSYKILLEELKDSTRIVRQIKYSDLGVPLCTFTADFVIDNLIVLEVSSFSRKTHPAYYSRILEKEVLIDSTNYVFRFCGTLAEVRAFIQEYAN
jgi:hypothetical protein